MKKKYSKLFRATAYVNEIEKQNRVVGKSANTDQIR